MNLVSLPVRVSSALIGTTATPVNRSIENFITQASLNAFLSSIRASSSTNAQTNLRNDREPIGMTHIQNRQTGDKIVKSLSELESLSVNGNKNILALKGNLTIVGCASNTFTMEGVRTVVVEGNIIFRCNTTYGSSDTQSSFAWITLGGNIIVDPGAGNDPQSGVSKLAGVYVAIARNNVGGQLRSLGDVTSQRILRVEGSLYGYAKPLLDSRLYTRGTSAYEILTTGTLISYSNRALVSPPPLLSEYLGNYTVERVVR